MVVAGRNSTIDHLLASLRQHSPLDTSPSRMNTRADDAYATQQLQEYKKRLVADNAWQQVGHLTFAEQQVLKATPTQTSAERTYNWVVPNVNRYDVLAEALDESLDEQQMNINNSNIKDNSAVNSNYNINKADMVAFIKSKKKDINRTTSSLLRSIKHPTNTSSFPTDSSTNSDAETQHTSNTTILLSASTKIQVTEHMDMSPSVESNIQNTTTTASSQPISSTSDPSAPIFPTQQTIPSSSHQVTKGLPSHTKFHDPSLAIPSTIPNAYDSDKAFTPTDKMATWHTTVEFPILASEVKSGYLKRIKERLTSFLSAVLAHTQGQILPWNETNTSFNPCKEVHSICESSETLSHYFRYELIPRHNKISGYMRLQVNARTKSIYQIKSHLLSVVEALQKYSIAWNKTYLTTMEKDTPFFLVGISDKVNFTQLNHDLQTQCEIDFPIHISRKPQEAKGIKKDNQGQKN